jgi:hypothetical protein
MLIIIVSPIDWQLMEACCPLLLMESNDTPWSRNSMEILLSPPPRWEEILTAVEAQEKAWEERQWGELGRKMLPMFTKFLSCKNLYLNVFFYKFSNSFCLNQDLCPDAKEKLMNKGAKRHCGGGLPLLSS